MISIWFLLVFKALNPTLTPSNVKKSIFERKFQNWYSLSEGLTIPYLGPNFNEQFIVIIISKNCHLDLSSKTISSFLSQNQLPRNVQKFVD